MEVGKILGRRKGVTIRYWSENYVYSVDKYGDMQWTHTVEQMKEFIDVNIAIYK